MDPVTWQVNWNKSNHAVPGLGLAQVLTRAFYRPPLNAAWKNLPASVTSANRAKPSQAEVDVSNQPRPARPGSLPSLGMLLTDRRSRSITGWFAPARPGSGGPTACLALLFLAWNDIPIDLWSADWSAHTRTQTQQLLLRPSTLTSRFRQHSLTQLPVGASK